MGRAENARRKRKEWENTLTTRKAVGQMLDQYDQTAVEPVRDSLNKLRAEFDHRVQARRDYMALPWWRRAWLTLKGEKP